MSKELKKTSGEYDINQVANGKNTIAKSVTAERAEQHEGVCKEFAAFRKEHPEIPYYITAGYGIAQGATKHSERKKGFTHFNGKFVLTIYRRCKQYAKYHGTENTTFDMVARLVAKYIDQFGGDPVKWGKALKKMNPNGKDALARSYYLTACKELGVDPTKRISTKRTTAKTNKAAKTKKTA